MFQFQTVVGDVDMEFYDGSSAEPRRVRSGVTLKSNGEMTIHFQDREFASSVADLMLARQLVALTMGWGGLTDAVGPKQADVETSGVKKATPKAAHSDVMQLKGDVANFQEIQNWVGTRPLSGGRVGPRLCGTGTYMLDYLDRKAIAEFYTDTPNGRGRWVYLHQDDWIVKRSDGHFFAVSDEEFNKIYNVEDN